MNNWNSIICIQVCCTNQRLLNFAVGVGFTRSELTGAPGSTIEPVVAITNGSLGPNETAIVQCVSLNGTAIGKLLAMHIIIMHVLIVIATV